MVGETHQKRPSALQSQLATAKEEAAEQRELSELLQYRIDELTQQLEQERADRLSQMQGTPERAPSPRMGNLSYSPLRQSPVGFPMPPAVMPTLISPIHDIQPRAVSPTRASSRSQVIDAQIVAWKNFVAAARKFNLSERDLVLVSSSTLKQLIHHCGFGANPIDVARIELSWRQRNDLGLDALDAASVRSHSVVMPTPSPCRPQSPTRSRGQASPGRYPSKARSRSASTNFKRTSTCGDEDEGFVVPVPVKKPTLSTRKCLSNRPASKSDPNDIKTGVTSPTGIRRYASREPHSLPPYVGSNGTQPMKIRGSHVAGLSNKSNISLAEGGPSEAQKLRPILKPAAVAQCNPNAMTDHQFHNTRASKARSPEPNRDAPVRVQGKRITGTTNHSSINFSYRA
eukprot:TRINITY_DN6088_c0_g1_i1.p1 TRINITY_DN6088_c0_g1~~TRINITY_DN6088_c0_g1_i1.p1  ORF type:complete len:415 (+),score=75.07 TRINITY_DN6088_c0_g1_i1:46-1245(+)